LNYWYLKGHIHVRFFLEVFTDSVTIKVFSVRIISFFLWSWVCTFVLIFSSGTWQFVLILKSSSLIGLFSPNLFWCQVPQLKSKQMCAHSSHKKLREKTCKLFRKNVNSHRICKYLQKKTGVSMALYPVSVSKLNLKIGFKIKAIKMLNRYLSNKVHWQSFYMWDWFNPNRDLYVKCVFRTFFVRHSWIQLPNNNQIT